MTQFELILEECRANIGKAKTETALNKLDVICRAENIERNTITLLNNRFHNNEKSKLEDVISQTDYQQVSNQINKALLTLISQVSSQLLEKKDKTKIINDTSNKNLKKIEEQRDDYKQQLDDKISEHKLELERKNKDIDKLDTNVKTKDKEIKRLKSLLHIGSTIKKWIDNQRFMIFFVLLVLAFGCGYYIGEKSSLPVNSDNPAKNDLPTVTDTIKFVVKIKQLEKDVLQLKAALTSRDKELKKLNEKTETHMTSTKVICELIPVPEHEVPNNESVNSIIKNIKINDIVNNDDIIKIKRVNNINKCALIVKYEFSNAAKDKIEITIDGTGINKFSTSIEKLKMESAIKDHIKTWLTR